MNQYTQIPLAERIRSRYEPEMQNIAVQPGSMYVSLVSAARELGDISLSTLQRAIARGEIASVRVGRRRLIPRSELARLLERAKQGNR